MKRILIFGATGNLGIYTTRLLKEKGYKVTAVGRKDKSAFFGKQDIPYYSIDIEKKEDFLKIPETEKFDAVIHFAGAMPAAMNGYHPEQYITSIVLGTLNILEFMQKREIPRIVYSQSHADSQYLMGKVDKIPSDIEKRFPLTGDHAVYSICKNAAVDLIEHYYHQFGVKRFILRLPTIFAYSPIETYNVDGAPRIMSYRHFINKAIKGDDIEVWGDPSYKRDLVYIKDLFQIIENAINAEIDGGVYNVGTGEGVSLLEQINAIIEVFGGAKKSKLIFKPENKTSLPFINDISKTSRELNYHPRYDVKKLFEAFKQDMEDPFWSEYFI